MHQESSLMSGFSAAGMPTKRLEGSQLMKQQPYINSLRDAIPCTSDKQRAKDRSRSRSKELPQRMNRTFALSSTKQDLHSNTLGTRVNFDFS